MPSPLPTADVDAFTSWTRAISVSRKAALFLFPLAALLAGGAVMANAERVHVATLIVTTINDGGPGSLPSAIAAASDGDTIHFDAALNGQTVALTSDELAIAKNITISGPGPNVLAVSRDQTAPFFRIFHVTPRHTVADPTLELRDGNGN